MFFDHKILHISEADVLETKMFGSKPMIILRVQTQQIYCVRDREGQVTGGGQDTIQTVFYSWAMQLMDSDEVPEEESDYPVSGGCVRCNRLASKLSYRAVRLLFVLTLPSLNQLSLLPPLLNEQCVRTFALSVQSNFPQIVSFDVS